MAFNGWWITAPDKGTIVLAINNHGNLYLLNGLAEAKQHATFASLLLAVVIIPMIAYPGNQIAAVEIPVFSAPIVRLLKQHL